MENEHLTLFDKIIFGPIKSRRLGLSLGVNLLPTDSKLCNFDCIYCECGWTDLKATRKNAFHDREEVKRYLEEVLVELKAEKRTLDSITFAGNGEPTMHPDFEEIIEDTLYLRNKYFHETKVAVLTNGTLLSRTGVLSSLKKIDMPIVKLDAGTEETFQLINQPLGRKTLRWLIDHMCALKGKIIIQTMFVRGKHKGVDIDNTTEREISAWIELLKEINPGSVMLYSLDRPTPEKNLSRISKAEMDLIASRIKSLGIKASVN